MTSLISNVYLGRALGEALHLSSKRCGCHARTMVQLQVSKDRPRSLDWSHRLAPWVATAQPPRLRVGAIVSWASAVKVRGRLFGFPFSGETARHLHSCKGYRPHEHETSYLLAFAWLQVTRSARGPVGPRADRVTCNHAKANSNLSSAQGRYLACFTKSRYEHKIR